MKVRAKQFSLDSTVTPTTATIDLGSDASPLQAVHSSEFVGELTGAVRFKAKNETGAAIAKGVAVYINGISGEVPTIALADADVSAAMPSVGLTETSVNNNAEVYIVSFGNLTGLNTAALGSNIVGKAVYIDTTAGGLTITPPSTNSAKLQNIGQVIREHASAGIIKVGGAGRTAATPNLDSGHFFIGSSNQSTQSSYELPTSIGTSGHVLTSDGTNVVFQAASGGGGGSTINVETIADQDHTLNFSSNDEDFYIINPATTNRTITLPNITSGSIPEGYKINIKNLSGTYSITISASSTGTADIIDASGVSHTLNNQYESITFVCSATTTWYRV